MKVTDLMVGDWVYNKHHKKNIQITPYDFFNHGHNGFGKQFLPTNPKLISGNDFDPIPLTEEILVKNGFLKRSGKEYYLKDDIVIFVGSDSCEVCTLYGECTAYSYVEEGYTTIATINYVHQLQHLLRLCGVEKEITLTD